MYISEKDKDEILRRSEGKLDSIIRDFITLRKSGTSWVGKCPKCGNEKGFSFAPTKSQFKCFVCNGYSGKTAIDFLMYVQDKSFPEALESLAKHINYFIEESKPQKPVIVKKGKGKPDSFCSRMLKESGLTDKDVYANVYKVDDKSSIFQLHTFFKGTMTSKGEIDRNGDDAIIAYYDLDGFPITYDVKDSKGKITGKTREYYRVRWQFPDEHPDKNGKPSKYKTPYGAGTFLYIPERTRKLYKEGATFERLYIHEGEKKSEKACKHGLPSVAISGIQNLGQNGRLPEDVIKIIQKCEVKEVCFMLDADWNDISSDIKINDQVERRPRNFFYAVRNFKDYFRSLKNRDLYIEIYFGHVLKNEANDKGIDDLLVNTLKGQEDELQQDIEYLINEKNLTGKYLQLYKITSATDHKLEEYWHLNNPAQFAEAHKSILKDLPEFRIGKHIWKFDDNGEFKSAQPIESDEQYWEEEKRTDRSGNEYTVYSFNYKRCFTFLQNRGFGRYRKLGENTGHIFIHLEGNTVKAVDPIDIRDYLTDFTKSVANEKVLNMLYKGGPQYVGPDKLSNLDYIHPNFEISSRDKQLFYFQNICWEITTNGYKELNYTNVTHHIWKNKKKDFSAVKTPSLINIVYNQESEKYSYKITDIGRKCHFLQFLINASNFTWRKEKLKVEIPPEELYDNIVHLVSKMSSIGFMLMEGKDRSTSKAVVSMDGKQSEVGASNGRSGKSIIGEMLKRVLNTVYINGKQKDMQADQFLWTDITEETKCVFIDDLRQRFDFEFLFANISGDWKVNYKGGGRATFPFPISPKIYLTTNHALEGEGSSFLDRQWLIAFSDFYNDTHKPIDDFGVLFFDEWDFEQWNLLWNLLAECVCTYLKFGVVESPGERLELRRLRQSITEEFLLWADEYFSNDSKRNLKIQRKLLYDEFLEANPEQRKYYKATTFKTRIIAYCKYKGYIFNPCRYDRVTGLPAYFDKDGKPELDDKSGGIEYFTIGDSNFTLSESDLPPSFNSNEQTELEF